MSSPTKATAVANRSSDTKQGDGWWMASDRRWYPPELHPSAASTQPSTSATVASTAPTAAATPGSAAGSAAPATAPAAKAQAPSAPTAAAAGAGVVDIKQATPTPQPSTPQPSIPQSPVPGAGVTRETPVDEQSPAEEESSASPNFVAGVVTSVGAVLALLGSLLTWATSTGSDVNGVGPINISFSGFASNGKIALILAVVMLILGVLLMKGIRPGWIFGLVACLCGAVIIALVFYSYVDITGRASDAWGRSVARETELKLTEVVAAGVGLKPSFGLWLAGLGGLLGALTPPFLRRDAVADDSV